MRLKCAGASLQPYPLHGEMGLREMPSLKSGQKVRIPRPGEMGLREMQTEKPIMSPAEVKDARTKLRLTQPGLAALLRMGKNGERQIRRWEDGEVPVSGPASVAIEALLSGWRPSKP